MNTTRRILLSLVAGAMFTGSLAIAAQGNDQVRSKTKVRAASKSTATTTMRTGGGSAIRNSAVTTRGNTVVRNGTVRNRSNVFVNGGNTVVRNRTVRNRDNVVVTRNGTVRNRNVVVSGTRYGSPSYSYGYGYPYSYGYGYPYYSYGPSVFGFGNPYYGYNSGYPYDYYGGYPSNYSYGYYGYTQPGYTTYANSSVVIAVQTRLARAGYYHGVIDGAMGPRTHYAIQAYERDHGLRVDGTISGPLLRNMGIRS
jgi:putative peptidoglycan binding protein